MSIIESELPCETRKRRWDNNCCDSTKRRKNKEEESPQWKLENDEVTTCILNSWLNENTEKELEVVVDTCTLETDSLSCADFDEEALELETSKSFDVDDESEEEICAGTVLPRPSKEECDFDTGSEFEFDSDEEEDQKIESERRVLILDLDNTLIHCTRDLDGELEMNLPLGSQITEDSLHLHNLEAILQSSTESIQDGWSHLYLLDASKISHVDEDQGVMVFKLRPGVIKFLQSCAKMYELAICTMGTANYAKCVKAMLERASGVEFTAGVLSREDFETGCQKCFAENWLEESAVIVDDRRDVWSNYERNLIQIDPFWFFSPPENVAVSNDEQGRSLKETLDLLGEVHQSTKKDPTLDVRDILEIIS